MAVRKAPDDPKGILSGKEGFSLQGVADHFDHVIGEVGDVAQGFVLDLSAFAVGTAQEVGDVDLTPLAVAYSGYVYRSISAWHASIIAISAAMSTLFCKNYWLHSENRTPTASLTTAKGYAQKGGLHRG